MSDNKMKSSEKTGPVTKSPTEHEKEKMDESAKMYEEMVDKEYPIRTLEVQMKEMLDKYFDEKTVSTQKDTDTLNIEDLRKRVILQQDYVSVVTTA